VTEEPWSHHPPRLAITGGIGSGKSTALAFLRELGAATLSSDDVVHALYADPDVQAALARRFGQEVVRGGQVQRAVLGRLVFADAEALSWLEEFTNPHVRRIVERWAAQQSTLAEPPAVLAVEVPLLFESGAMLGLFDCVLLVTAPVDVRRRRVAAKLTAEEFDRRMQRQLSEAVKAERSHFVYENAGTRKEMKGFIAETFASILSCAAAVEHEARGGR
jgi:dephospho-CoA kinase